MLLGIVMEQNGLHWVLSNCHSVTISSIFHQNQLFFEEKMSKPPGNPLQVEKLVYIYRSSARVKSR